MTLYLSSYRVGDRPDDLHAATSGRTVGVVCNSLEHVAWTGREMCGGNTFVLKQGAPRLSYGL